LGKLHVFPVHLQNTRSLGQAIICAHYRAVLPGADGPKVSSCTSKHAEQA